MSARTDLYDVAIVGAGPAGSAAATHLARAGQRVALLEKGAFPREKACAEYLSPAAEPLLRALGAFDALDTPSPARLRGFRVYAPSGAVFQGDFAATHDASGASLFTTGLAIPRLRLDAALAHAAVRAGAQLRERWQLADVAREGEHWRLEPAAGGEPLRARLLIGADGVHSTVARRLGMHVPGRLRKIALVAHLRGIAGLTDYGEMHIAGRRYVGLAPLEMPGGGDLCNVAMVVDERRDGARLAGRPEAFLLEALGTFPKLRDRLRETTVARRTLAVSRLSAHARQLAGDAFLLIGDAGGYFDPFTGEGIYRALRSAEIAASVALPALTAGTLDAATLTRYERLCHAEFRGKRAVEAIIQSAVQVPPLMNHLAALLRRKADMPHTVVAVTGDFLPASAI
ncbi:MAG: NAD(P)/FAD-dependent oxidoreductase, partial [Ktedonobacterales bacterium]